MIVKCIANKIFGEGNKPTIEHPNLEVGRCYVVYHMTISSDGSWYTWTEESGDIFPISYPAELFEIVDNRISRYWAIRNETVNGVGGAHIYVEMSFKEWVEDPSFHNKISEGGMSGGDGEYKEQIDTFLKYKSLMDVEFSHPVVTDKANLLEGNWYMCPECTSSWKDNNNLAEMTCCESCKKFLLK